MLSIKIWMASMLSHDASAMKLKAGFLSPDEVGDLDFEVLDSSVKALSDKEADEAFWSEHSTKRLKAWMAEDKVGDLGFENLDSWVKHLSNKKGEAFQLKISTGRLKKWMTETSSEIDEWKINAGRVKHLMTLLDEASSMTDSIKLQADFFVSDEVGLGDLDFKFLDTMVKLISDKEANMASLKATEDGLDEKIARCDGASFPASRVLGALQAEKDKVSDEGDTEAFLLRLSAKKLKKWMTERSSKIDEWKITYAR